MWLNVRLAKEHFPNLWLAKLCAINDGFVSKGGDRLAVMGSGFSRGHYIAGLIYGVIATNPDSLTAPRRAVRSRFESQLLPETAVPGEAGDLPLRFGRCSNANDFIKGLATSRDARPKVASQAYKTMTEALAAAKDVQHGFLVQGQPERFTIGQMYCVCNIGARMPGIYAHGAGKWDSCFEERSR